MRSTLSGGLGPFRFVRVGDDIESLPETQRKAIILHELGHLFHHHPASRLKLLLTGGWLNWRRLREIAQAQEFMADAFVAEMGHADALIAVLTNNPSEGGPWHPSTLERIENLHRLAGVTSLTAQCPLSTRKRRNP